MTRPWNFKHHVRWAEDASITARNARSKGANAKETDQPGLEWGAWFELTDEDDKISPAVIAFLADIFKSMPDLLPKEERVGLGRRSATPSSHFC